MNKPSRRVVLTGFMGAGKSVVAESLAAHFDCRMVDLDALIAGREGRSISAIIDEDGEERFREMETAALLDALQYKAAWIIALGGGTWALEKNRRLIAEDDCLTVWLDTPFELCWKRISNEDKLRPLARDRGKTKGLYDLRKASYALAMLHIEVSSEDSVEGLTVRIIRSIPES